MDLADLRGLQPQIFPTNLKTEKAWVKNGSFSATTFLFWAPSIIREYCQK